VKRSFEHASISGNHLLADELEILDLVLEEWRAQRGLSKDNPDVELAAARCSTCFARETEQSKS
jgi:hypothetical protein